MNLLRSKCQENGCHLEEQESAAIFLLANKVPPEILAVEEQQHVLQLHFNTAANKTAFILDVVFTNKKTAEGTSKYNEETTGTPAPSPPREEELDEPKKMDAEKKGEPVKRPRFPDQPAITKKEKGLVIFQARFLQIWIWTILIIFFLRRCTWWKLLTVRLQIIGLHMHIPEDETGTASLVLFEKDCKNLLDGTSAYQLLATQERGETSDATVKDKTVSPLDLASVTDDNGTPLNF